MQCYIISICTLYTSYVLLVSVLVERMEDVDIFRLQTAFVTQLMGCCSH